MLYGDDKLLRRCRPHLATVVVADPFPAASRLLCDLLKQAGASSVLPAPDASTADRLIAAHAPTLIFTEHAAALDGTDLVRRLRRSEGRSRAVPAIICTAETTEATLKAARDAGVHEILCKPFTVGHLIKRIEAACFTERDWIEARFYVGPCRRRFNSAGYAGPRKREADKPPEPEVEAAEAAADVAVLGRVLKAIKTALEGYDSNPPQALRAMLEQSAELQALAFSTEDADLKGAVLSLQRYLLAALESGTLQPSVIAQHAGALEKLSRIGGTAGQRRGLVDALAVRAA